MQENGNMLWYLQEKKSDVKVCWGTRNVTYCHSCTWVFS